MSLVRLILLFILQAPTPEQKAVNYMVSEVPRWPTENHCFSCHNNGDGARALYLARRLKYTVPSPALETTTAWHQKPGDWAKSQQGFGDEKLALIQFGAALADAMDLGIINDKNLLLRAADQLLPHQSAEGAWQVDVPGSSPSAVGYGSTLATYMARRTLERAENARFNEPIARADRWLRAADIATTVNAAAVVLAFDRRNDAASKAKFDQALAVLLKSQNSNGGWGDYPRTPSESFETAMALLALNTERNRPEIKTMIDKGRAFLVSMQAEDGGWPATLQGGGTYARHLSTSAWATQALLSTK